MTTVLSFGGGVNSTAMLCGILEREAADIFPDLILFSDTGGEKPETYRFIEAMSQWVIRKMAVNTGITIVREERFTLEQECLDKKTLPSIVIGMRSCSDKFKIRPQNRFVANWQPAIDAWANGERVIKLVGFDAGEPWRAKDYSDKKFEVRFPLIEWGWDREACIAAIERAGLPIPPKSSCFFCPEMRETEILDLKQNSPDLFARAVAMERNNANLVTIKGLARTHSWEQIASYDEAQMRLLPKREQSMPCMCFDGEK
jgi:hypothetical protein